MALFAFVFAVDGLKGALFSGVVRGVRGVRGVFLDKVLLFVISFNLQFFSMKLIYYFTANSANI